MKLNPQGGKWRRLDNTAKIFPVIANEHLSNVFRISMTLNEEIVPEVLQQAAAVRLQYPDLSLTALCGCFDPAVSKSGLSHRMKKLEALADALRQRVEKGQEAEP